MPPSWSDISGAGLDGLAMRGFDNPVIAFPPQTLREITGHAGGMCWTMNKGTEVCFVRTGSRRARASGPPVDDPIATA